ncbi:hypothetical protein QYE76_023471 [Lolium multiflorum]|uniref:Transposase (putative) gypsy type domain-containing protein n=1 Tax=Lolium multiflorum TaxID=4521 RepID=A0AAD8REI2_LOLMU|nr:hypothetical protein QYE76_023471 [Lolium multiflorum]
MIKRDEKKAHSLGLISPEEGNFILPGLASHPNPPAGFTVMFISLLYRGLFLPAHEFLRRLLHVYGIQLWQLTPDSILHLVIFITRCEAFLGIDPHWGLWKKIFFVKRYKFGSGSFVTGGVGIVVRKQANYFNFPMRESVQGVEIEVVLPQRFIGRAHQMWLYSGPKDETRVNVAELSEKELLDEVRRLTHFSQEDSIPLLALQEPYDFDHQSTEVPSTAEYFPNVSDENLEEGDSTVNIESCAEENEVLEDEDNDHANPEAFSADHRSFVDDLSDTSELNHDNGQEAANIPAGSIGKLPDSSSADALSMEIESGDLIRALLQKNKRFMSRLHAMIFPKANQEKSLEQLTDTFAVDTEGTIEAFKRTLRACIALLAFQLMMGHDFKADMDLMTKEMSKDQDGQAMDLSLFEVSARKCAPQLLELVTLVPSFVESSLAGDSESDRLQCMKARILQMENDMRGIHAMAAIIKKKGELAIDAERYALSE